MFAIGVYTGKVRHTRTRPRTLALEHRCFWLGLDIDAIADVARQIAFFSYNRWNVLSFYDRDHGDGSGRNLRDQVETLLQNAALPAKPERIMLFSMPRVAGYGFNPLSVYFCSDEKGELQSVIYEVHNTFGQRHSYVAPVAGGVEQIVQSSKKAFYVSPFMDMDMSYIFKLRLLDGKVSLAIQASDAEGPIIFTSLSAHRRALTSANLLVTWLRHPLLTLKVIAAIHFHAARLWLKGIKLRLRPPPPELPATLGHSGKFLP